MREDFGETRSFRPPARRSHIRDHGDFVHHHGRILDKDRIRQTWLGGQGFCLGLVSTSLPNNEFTQCPPAIFPLCVRVASRRVASAEPSLDISLSRAAVRSGKTFL